MDKTSSEWEVLSDADSRLNEGEVVDVEELQKKVDKRWVVLLYRDSVESKFIRRSNFQYLEDELNALNARIKAAEERAEGLKRAHAQSGLALGGNETHQQ
jgi:hypothetical protein